MLLPTCTNLRQSCIKFLVYSSIMTTKPARILTFKCTQCEKPVKVFLQKVSACSHIQPYMGICDCGEVRRYATGQKDAVESYLASEDGNWSHHH